MSDELVTGTAIQAAVVFRDAEGDLVDPVTITFTIDPPAAVAAVFIYGIDGPLVRDSLGKYHVNYTLNDNGRWAWKWAGDGVSVDSGYINVTDPRI